MHHLGRYLRWVNLSDKNIFPKELITDYNRIIDRGMLNYKKDFTETIETRVRSIQPVIIKLRGIRNLGLSCFVNVSFQLLFASRPFVSFLHYMIQNFSLLSEEDKAFLPSWTRLVDFLRNNFTFEEVDSFKDSIFPDLSTIDYTTLDTAISLKELDPIFGMFKSDRYDKQQEDASEFLIYFISLLHEELVAFSKASGFSSNINGNYTENFHKTKFYVTIGEQSALKDIFSIITSSKTYKGREMRSENTEVVTVLQVPIDECSTLDDCIAKFSEKQYIDDVISRETYIAELPISLIINLLRFTNYGKKIKSHIYYKETLEINVGNKKFTYRLHAIVEHIGDSSFSGHYRCYVKRFDGKWFLCDDDNVKQVANYPVSDNCYLLLYNQVA